MLYASFKFVRKFKFCVSPLVRFRGNSGLLRLRFRGVPLYIMYCCCFECCCIYIIVCVPYISMFDCDGFIPVAYLRSESRINVLNSYVKYEILMNDTFSKYRRTIDIRWQNSLEISATFFSRKLPQVCKMKPLWTAFFDIYFFSELNDIPF